VKIRCISFVLVLAPMLLLTGCGGTLKIEPVKTPDVATEPAVDVDATIATVVAATLTAQPTVDTDGTVSTAVAATLTAVRTTSPPITATETLTPTPTPTPSPTLSPTPSRTPSPTPCGLEAHPSLMAAWDRSRIGCAQDSATVVWAAWQPFEGGYMLWRSDSMDVYILYRQGATNAGFWELWFLDWDGSNAGGIGLPPPPGRLEPVRGFGWVWREHLDGPDGPLGWALEREKGFCARVQTFESGIIVGSTPDPSCAGQEPGNATDPSLAPFVCALYGNRTWECY
jgi:hypothetical protein